MAQVLPALKHFYSAFGYVPHNGRLNVYVSAVPSISVGDYEEALMERMQLDEGILIYACHYFQKLIYAGVYASAHSVHRMVAASTLVAYKYVEDEFCVPMSVFSAWCGVDRVELYSLEEATLRYLRWELYMNLETYKMYRKKLKSLSLKSSAKIGRRSLWHLLMYRPRPRLPEDSSQRESAIQNQEELLRRARHQQG